MIRDNSEGVEQVAHRGCEATNNSLLFLNVPSLIT